MRFALSMLLVAGVAGCGSSLSEPAKSGMTGTIVARDVATSGGSAPTVHIKADNDNCGVIYVVDDHTELLLRKTDGKLARASLSEFTVGRRATVWANAVADSCPGQSYAEALEIFDL